MIKKMGPLKDIFEKLPFFADGMPEGVNFDDNELVKAEAIVSSMTKHERVETELFQRQPNRLTRVAKGSGRSEHEVARADRALRLHAPDDGQHRPEHRPAVQAARHEAAAAT